MEVYRTHNCNELSVMDVDKKVILSGWVHRIRDHGGVLFIDLRDHYGMTQCVIENNNNFFPVLEKILKKERPNAILPTMGGQLLLI